jgi:hypothetical protein
VYTIILRPYVMEAFDHFLKQVDDYVALAERVVGELVAERQAFEKDIADVAQEIPAATGPPAVVGPNDAASKRLSYYAEGIYKKNPDLILAGMRIKDIRDFLDANPSPADENERWQQIVALKDDLQFQYMRFNGGIGQIFLKLKPKRPQEIDRVTIDYSNKAKPIIEVIDGVKFQSKFTKIFQQTSTDSVEVKRFNDDFCETILRRNLTSIDLGSTTAVLLSYGQSGSGKTFSNELLYEAIAKHVETSSNKLIGTRAFQFYNDCNRSQDVTTASIAYQGQRKASLKEKDEKRVIPLTVNIDGTDHKISMVEPPLPLLLQVPAVIKQVTATNKPAIDYYPFNPSNQLVTGRSLISYKEAVYNQFKRSGTGANYKQIPPLSVKLVKRGDHYVQDIRPDVQFKIENGQLLGTPEQLSHLFFEGGDLDDYFHRFYSTRIYDMHLFPEWTPELKIKESEMQHLIPYQQFRNQKQGEAVGLNNGSNFATFDHSELMYPMFKPTTEKAISEAYKLGERYVAVQPVPEMTQGGTVKFLKELIAKFGKHRFTRSMKSNDDSSRSQLVVELYFKNGSKLVIMDLAGNESVLTSSKPNQISFYEGMYINQTLDFVRDLAVAIMSRAEIKPNPDAFAQYLSTLTKATLTILVCAFESSPAGIEGVIEASNDAFDFVKTLDDSLPAEAKLTGNPLKTGTELGGNRRRTFGRKLNKYLSYVKHKRVFGKNKTVYKKRRTRKNKLR